MCTSGCFFDDEGYNEVGSQLAGHDCGHNDDRDHGEVLCFFDFDGNKKLCQKMRKMAHQLNDTTQNILRCD